jgi:hypothetical protein
MLRAPAFSVVMRSSVAIKHTRRRKLRTTCEQLLPNILLNHEVR